MDDLLKMHSVSQKCGLGTLKMKRRYYGHVLVEVPPWGHLFTCGLSSHSQNDQKLWLIEETDY